VTSEEPVLFPSEVGLALGAEGIEVESLQHYLRRFGYLRSDDAGAFGPMVSNLPTPEAAPGRFDDATSDALRRYQLFHGLPPTAELDLATVAQMSIPRCGFPDVTGVSRFVVQGNRWNPTDLRYGSENLASDLGQQEVRSAIRQTAALWSAVTPLTFREVGIGEDPEVKISFVVGDHGDGLGNAFDGPNGVLAHAYFPPPQWRRHRRGHALRRGRDVDHLDPSARRRLRPSDRRSS